MVKFLKQAKPTIAIIILLVVLSLLSIFALKLNLGTYFYNSKVLILQFDQEQSIEKVIEETSKLSKFSGIEKESTSKFHVYFQNLTEEQEQKILSDLPLTFPGLLKINFFNYQPAREHFLVNRISILINILILLGFIFAIFQLRNKGIKRGELLSLLFNESLLLVFMFLVVTGFVSLLGGLGVVMDIPFFVFSLSAILLILVFEVYYIFRFSDTSKNFVKYDLVEIEKKLSKDYWPEFLFILLIAGIVLFMPWVVVSSTLSIYSTQLIVALLISAYTFFFVRPHLNRFALLNRSPFNKWRVLNKQW